MVRVLEHVFDEYLASIYQSGQEKTKLKSKRLSTSFWYKKAEKDLEVKDATLIVLTDGVWPHCQRAEFVRIFRAFTEGMNQLERVINSKYRSYSVEFVRFGEDPYAISLLNYLDDELVKHIDW
jgi:hypothetical protein